MMKFLNFRRLKTFRSLKKQTGKQKRAKRYFSGMLDFEKLVDIVGKDPEKRKLFKIWEYASELSETRLAEKGMKPEAINFFVEEGVLVELPAGFEGKKYFLSHDKGTSLLSRFTKE